MAVVPNPIPNPNNPFVRAAGGAGSSGVSKGALELAKEQAQLQKGLASTVGRIASSPRAIASGRVNPFIQEAQKIAQGGDRKATGVLGTILNSPLGRTLTGAATVLGTGQRAIVSTLKEGYDLYAGGDASFDDWWKQTKDPHFGVGKLIRDAGGLTGNKALDVIIGFAGDVATDPLTYLMPTTIAGRGARLALAARAAEAATIAKAPTLANKIDDIVRIGEWALDDAERAVLNVPKGLRFGVGQRNVLLPKTGKVAETVGANWARFRAGLGDFGLSQKTMSKVLPASYAGDMISLGRGELSSKEATQALASWTARSHGMAANRVFNARMGARYTDLLTEISKSPYRETVALVAEGSRTAVDDAERALADRILAMQEELFTAANDAANEFARKRGITRPVGINRIDDYGLHHAITDEARRWVKTMGDSPTPEFLRMVREGQLSVDELINGVGPARWRKLRGQVVDEQGNVLKRGEEWLGVELQRGTIDEINQISVDRLGFKWFEEDAPTIMNSYMQSMGKQVNRTAAMDRLMDYGVDYVKPLLQKAVPDKELVASWESAVAGIKKAQRILQNNVKANAGRVEAALGRTGRKIGNVLADGRDKVVATTKQLADASAALDGATRQLDDLQRVVDSMIGPERATMQEAIDSSKGTIEKLRSQIARNDGWRAQSHDQLVAEYLRVFPNTKRIPTDDEVIVQRLRAANVRSNKILESKVAARDRLSAKVAELRRTAKAGDKRLAAFESQLRDVEQEIDGLRWVTEAASAAPYTDNGLVYMPVEGAQQGGAVILDTSATTMLSQGADPSQVIAMRAPANVLDISDPANIDDFLQGFSDGIGASIAELTQNMPNAIPQLENLAEEISANMAMALERNSSEFLDPLWAQVHPEIAKMIDDAVEFKMAAVEAAQLGGDIPEYMTVEFMNAVSDSLEAFARANDLAVGFGDQAVIDALGATTMTLAGDSVGLVVPASVVNPMADVGETALILPRNSGLLDPNNLDSSPRLLAEDPTYMNLAVGGNAAEKYQLDLMAQREAAQGAAREQELQNILAQEQLATAGEARTAAGREVEKSRRVAQRGEAGVEEPALLREKADRVTIYEKDPKTGARKRVTYNRESAERRLAELEKDVEKQVNKLDRFVQQAERAEVTGPSGITGTVAGSRKAVERAQRVMSKAELLAADAADWQARALPQYLDDVARVTGAISRNPTKNAATDSAGLWAQRSLALLKGLDDAVRAGDTELEALQRVVQQLVGDEADLAILESVTLPRAEMYLSAAQSGKIGSKLVEDIEKGWVAIDGLGVQMPKEMRDLMYPNLQKLKDPKEFGPLWDLYQKYNQFFKIYATLTPGFSIRNAISATFMNYVAGVGTQSIRDGLTAAKAYVRYGPDKFIERLGLSATDKVAYEQAYRMALATGQGQSVNDMLAPLFEGRANRVLKNKATVASAKFNEGVEFAARFAMALHDVRAGLSFDDGVQRISRFHFDYTDLSKLDKFMKNWVPFWIWTSRNVPLQFANMWTRPRVYAFYDHLRDNAPPDSTMMMPKWLAESRPIGLGRNLVLNPDLPMNQYVKQVEQLSDPKRLLGNLNPIAKIPFEAYSSTQFSTDIPFGNEPVPARGLDLLAALVASPFGGVQRNAEGQVVISPKLQYQLGNILPPVARLQRLVPQAGLGGKGSYADRQLSSALGFFGVPVRQVTEQEQRNEAIRRQRELSDLIARLRQLGFIESQG